MLQSMGSQRVGHDLAPEHQSLVAQMVKNRLQCRRPGFDPWVGKIPWRRECNLLQNSCLEKSMDRRAWRATADGVTQSGADTGWERKRTVDGRARGALFVPLQAGSGSPHLVLMPLVGRAASPPRFQLSSPPCPPPAPSPGHCSPDGSN